MIENKKSNKDSGKIMIKALKLSKIKAFMLFLKVHQKFRPYSIIRAIEDALSVHEQLLRFLRIKHEKTRAAEKQAVTENSTNVRCTKNSDHIVLYVLCTSREREYFELFWVIQRTYLDTDAVQKITNSLELWALQPFFEVHQKFRPYSIICA